MTMSQRAYSTLELKAMDAEGGKRVFRGIASTPSTDRMGDIVEPLGAEFQLPIPLLWQYDSRDPIGWITEAKVGPNGIGITGEVATVDMPGPLQERLLLAWQYLQAKLVRGLSIGFQPLESSRIEGTYSYRYTKWSWYELSAVTIPANQDCSITAVKSADEALRRALLGQKSQPVVRLDGTSPPGVPGPQRRPGAVYLN